MQYLLLLLALPAALAHYNYYECPAGWTLMGDRCIKAYNGQKSWTEARASCQRFGGDLAEVYNEKENNIVKSVLDSKKRYWFGACDLPTEGHWAFISGRAMTWDYWGKHEPNNHLNKEDCAEFAFKGYWNDMECGFKMNFICQRTAKKLDHHCSAGWSPMGQLCLMAFNVNALKKTWTEAKTACENVDGDLVEIYNLAQNNRVFSVIDPNARYWMGACDLPTERVWNFNSGRPMVYRYWGSGEPNNVDHNEHCAEINFNKHWNDENCATKMGFVCQRKNNPGCKDENKLCAKWALLGECKKNNAYMHDKCKRSCGKCNDDCVNKNQYCEAWAKQGFCATKEYMWINCKPACNLCI